MNEISWSKRAMKQLRKLPAETAQTIHKGVEALRFFPDCGQVKKLTNHKYDYRLRVGNYRVFFDFEGEIRVVFVEEVRKRDERTY